MLLPRRETRHLSPLNLASYIKNITIKMVFTHVSVIHSLSLSGKEPKEYAILTVVFPKLFWHRNSPKQVRHCTAQRMLSLCKSHQDSTFKLVSNVEEYAASPGLRHLSVLNIEKI